MAAVEKINTESTVQTTTKKESINANQLTH